MVDSYRNYTHGAGSEDWRSDVQDLFGVPYLYAGRDRSGFDCWGLVWFVYSKIFGVELPDHPSHKNEADKIKRLQAHMDSPDWSEIRRPEHMAVVALGRGRRVGHVGVWVDIDDGICLHVVNHQHVVGHTVQQLKGQKFNIIKFFRFNG